MPQEDQIIPSPAGSGVVELELPPPRPALLSLVDPDALRWQCLCLIESLRDGELAAHFPEPPDEFADLAGEFAELVVNGIAGDRHRAALAVARIEGRHPQFRLSARERQVWLERWAGLLRRKRLPTFASRPLWQWMATLTERWLGAGETREVAAPLVLYRR